MKKALMILVVFVLMLPVSNAFAYEGGLLHGQTLEVDKSGVKTNTQLLTDGDALTRMYADNNSNGMTFTYTFSKPHIIDSYRLDASSVYGTYTLIMYHSDGTNTTKVLGVRNSVKTTFTPVADVVKVVLRFNLTTANGVYINDFDVFGYSNSITYDSVTSLSETHNYNSVNLSWVNPSHAQFTGTIIKQNGVEVTQLANTTSSYSFNGLDADTLYNFEVIAKYSDGVNSSGKTVSVTTDSVPSDLTPPSNITNVQVAKSNELASFLYTLPVDTDFSHLKIYRDGELKETFFTGTSYDDFSLVSNTTYVYKFVSVDLSGNESNGFVQSVTTDVTVDTVAPNAPTGVEVTNGGSSGLVKWEISSEADVKGYNVFVDGVKHNTSLIMANSYTIPNLVNDQNYLITVTAVDTSENESVPSTVQTLTPSSQAMPIFNAKYDLKDVADGTSSWFNSMWLILAFSVGIPLAFMIARRVKGLLIA